MSPLSYVGFGKQLLPNARTRVAIPTNGIFREIVFLMRTAGPPDFGQSEKLLPLNLLVWGWLVYTTDSGLLGIASSLRMFHLVEICVISNLIL